MTKEAKRKEAQEIATLAESLPPTCKAKFDGWLECLEDMEKAGIDLSPLYEDKTGDRPSV